MKRVMSVLFAAVLLCLPSVSLAQGNAFGGGGGGIPTDPTESIYTDGTDLILTTPGAGVVVEPAANTGSTLVFSEGTIQGTSTLSLGVGAGGLATNISCEFNAMGALPITCPIYKWYQPSRMAVKALDLDPTSTSTYDSLCNAAGACYVPTENLVTNGPNTLFTGPGGATCTEVSNTACSHPLTLGGVGATDWILSATATVVTKGTSDCSIIVYENNLSAQVALRIDMGLGEHINEPGDTITRTAPLVSVLAGATKFYGVYRNSDTTVPFPCETGASFDWEVDYILEAIQQ